MNEYKIFLGPCVIDEKTQAIAKFVRDMKYKYVHGNFKFIFKASYDKANRTDWHAYRGYIAENVIETAPEEARRFSSGLFELDKVKKDFDLPIVTDVHEPRHVPAVACYADFIQIPAMLMRQTDLLLAVAKTEREILMKVQQMAGIEQVSGAVGKIMTIEKAKVPHICYRGTAFGRQLVFDLEFVWQLANGFPTVVDITHTNNGNKDLSFMYARACALWTEGMFMEVYPTAEEAKEYGCKDTSPAKSDGRFALSFSQVDCILDVVMKTRKG